MEVSGFEGDDFAKQENRDSFVPSGIGFVQDLQGCQEGRESLAFFESSEKDDRDFARVAGLPVGCLTFAPVIDCALVICRVAVRVLQGLHQGDEVGQVDGAIDPPAVTFDFSFEEVGGKAGQVGVVVRILFDVVGRPEPVWTIGSIAAVGFPQPLEAAMVGDADEAVTRQHPGTPCLNGATGKPPNGGEFYVNDGIGKGCGDRADEKQTAPAVQVEPRVVSPSAAIENGLVEGLEIEEAIDVVGGEDVAEAGGVRCSTMGFAQRLGRSIAATQQQNDAPAFLSKFSSQGGVIRADAAVFSDAFKFVTGENGDFLSGGVKAIGDWG